MTTKKAPAKAPSKSTAAGKTHKWTEDQLRYLADNATSSKSDLVAGFRKKFPDFTGSDVSITGRRYTLVHKGSKRNPALTRTSLEARAKSLREELATVEAQLADLGPQETPAPAKRSRATK